MRLLAGLALLSKAHFRHDVISERGLGPSPERRRSLIGSYRVFHGYRISPGTRIISILRLVKFQRSLKIDGRGRTMLRGCQVEHCRIYHAYKIPKAADAIHLAITAAKAMFPSSLDRLRKE
jgi:hypothetical protein